MWLPRATQRRADARSFNASLFHPPLIVNLVVRVDYAKPVTIVHNTVNRSYYQSQ
jgi:hypothetical protein